MFLYLYKGLFYEGGWPVWNLPSWPNSFGLSATILVRVQDQLVTNEQLILYHTLFLFNYSDHKLLQKLHMYFYSECMVLFYLPALYDSQKEQWQVTHVWNSFFGFVRWLGQLA